MRASYSRWRRTVQTVLCAGALIATGLSAGAAQAANNPFRNVDGFVECSDEYEVVQPGYESSNYVGSCDAYGSCNVGACGCGEGCYCGDCCGPYCPWGHCTSVWGEALYLHATGADMVHAQQQDGLGGQGTAPLGHIGAVDPNYEPGFRVGANIGLSNASSFAMSYMYYESSAVDTVVPPTIAGGGGATRSLVLHPGTITTSSSGQMIASYDIDFQLADFEFRRLLFGDKLGWMNYSVGARYANLEQEFFQAGNAVGGGPMFTRQTRTDIDFDGGGAMFGLDGERRFGRRGLSVYGNVGVSPIVGQFSADYESIDTTNPTIGAARAQWKDDRFITIVDFEVGLAWTSPGQKWRLSTGYLAQFWFNTLTTPEFVDAVQAENYTDRGDTLSFDGATARIERRF